MKTCIGLLIMAGTLAGQTVYAQSAAPLTRAQVREELIRLEAAGYDPSRGDDGEYPADIQAAEARAAAQENARIAASAADDAGTDSRARHANPAPM